MIITKNNYHYYEIPEKVINSKGAYSIEDKLGIGGNAAVYECTDLLGNVYAIKFLLNFREKDRQRFEQEISLLKELKHPHIIDYIDCGSVMGTQSKGNSIDIPYLIMKKADSNIIELMKKNEVMSYEMYASQIRGLADALRCLHEKAVHRDIKPENILVCGETWMLSDFGLCSAIDEAERLDVTHDRERVGPKYWLSPEATDKVYFGANNICEASDVYQLSAVFWFIITKRYPLGVICRDDYLSTDNKVCEESLKSMTYDINKRTPNGMELYQNICNVTINRDL